MKSQTTVLPLVGQNVYRDTVHQFQLILNEFNGVTALKKLNKTKNTILLWIISAFLFTRTHCNEFLPDIVTHNFIIFS